MRGVMRTLLVTASDWRKTLNNAGTVLRQDNVVRLFINGTEYVTRSQRDLDLLRSGIAFGLAIAPRRAVKRRKLSPPKNT